MRANDRERGLTRASERARADKSQRGLMGARESEGQQELTREREGG